MSNTQPATKPKDAAPFSDSIDVRIVLGDSFDVRLGSGGGGGLIHSPQLLGQVGPINVNGNG